jgi:hypothetical protein
MNPENVRILSLKEKDIWYAALRDWLRGNLIITPCFK